MRVVLKAILGAALSAAALGYGASALIEAATPAPAQPPRPSAERRVAAALGVLEPTEATPVIEAYGRLRSRRTAQIRAPVGGRIVGLAPDFREGARVEEGAMLLRIDPADYASAVAATRLGVAEAAAEVLEADQAVAGAALELQAARRVTELRVAALARQQGLADRGVAAAALAEEASLALAAAEQAEAARGQALIAARQRVTRAALAVDRADLALAEAERRLAETEVRALYPGVLAELSATVGDVLSANERVGAVIDPAALEAELSVSLSDFAALLAEDGALRPDPVIVSLPLAGAVATVSGALDRASPQLAAGGAARSVFARLDLDPGTPLRPGDFVSVEIVLPAVAGVAVVPAAAVTEDGRILIVDAADRLREAQTRVVRRMGDVAIVADAPFGARYVLSRGPHLGEGLLVRTPAGDDAGAPVARAPQPAGATGRPPGAPAAVGDAG